MIGPNYRGKPIPKDWRDTLKTGDILLTPSRDLRVVRDVKYKKNGYLHTIHLAIRRCSWTGRSYTTYCRSDLATLGYRKAGLRARMDGTLDKQLATCLQYENRFKQSLTCKDAKALA